MSRWKAYFCWYIFFFSRLCLENLGADVYGTHHARVPTFWYDAARVPAGNTSMNSRYQGIFKSVPWVRFSMFFRTVWNSIFQYSKNIFGIGAYSKTIKNKRRDSTSQIPTFSFPRTSAMEPAEEYGELRRQKAIDDGIDSADHFDSMFRKCSIYHSLCCVSKSEIVNGANELAVCESLINTGADSSKTIHNFLRKFFDGSSGINAQKQPVILQEPRSVDPDLWRFFDTKAQQLSFDDPNQLLRAIISESKEAVVSNTQVQLAFGSAANSCRQLKTSPPFSNAAPRAAAMEKSGPAIDILKRRHSPAKLNDSQRKLVRKSVAVFEDYFLTVICSTAECK